MTDAVERFTTAALERGLAIDVVTMAQSTHTAAEAARAVGCEEGAIVKSLVVLADGEPMIALVSGTNRVDVELVSRELDAKVTMSDARTVKDATGYSIGGVPPFGHRTTLRTIIDSDLLRYDRVWAAAGSAVAVFSIDPDSLIELTAGEVTNIN
ncbi:MAG: YbaK/EbsC family protein [Cryobacterium sp.]|jgi:Cys-tRNA(Pro) deacylase|nr:YbaK/EbsC family protein [Cryobacterium sp.]